MRFIYVLSFFALAVCSSAQQSEAYYCNLIHQQLGGEREVTVTSGLVDIVTETHAYEVEWAKNWKHSIGQALWYGLQTNKKPGVVLIIRENKEFKYLQQLNSALCIMPHL
jgi:DNA gyrase/topoisomerase IV subunit B